MTCPCGCGKTYLDISHRTGKPYEVQFAPNTMHCRGCGYLVGKDQTRGGLCIECLWKKLKNIGQPILFSEDK